jgi:hypothetical protein
MITTAECWEIFKKAPLNSFLWLIVGGLLYLTVDLLLSL